MRTTGFMTAAAVVLVAFAGCGSNRNALPTYRAGGKVAFPDGTPLKGGWVEFRSVNLPRQVTARGQIQSDGTFKLGTYKPGDGAVEGEHCALVMPPPSRTKTNPDALRRSKGGLGSLAPAPGIDPRFGRFETSGLKFTVTSSAADNQFLIQVRRPGE